MLSNPSPKPEEENPTGFHYCIEDALQLNRPATPDPISFWDVLDKRRSARTFHKLSLDEIGNVLWLSAKVKDISVQENGYILTHRPSASAGARHPIDVLVLSPVLDNSESCYYYNPFEHSLNKLRNTDGIIDHFLNHINSVFQTNDGTIIWFVAHSIRTAAKYENPLSLIWRDAGALIHSVQLACTVSNINSCPVGTLGEPFISQMFPNNENIISAGGIVIG
jgi:SagB-type dehydrogenase family enzyme